MDIELDLATATNEWEQLLEEIWQYLENMENTEEIIPIGDNELIYSHFSGSVIKHDQYLSISELRLNTHCSFTLCADNSSSTE